MPKHFKVTYLLTIAFFGASVTFSSVYGYAHIEQMDAPVAKSTNVKVNQTRFIPGAGLIVLSGVTNMNAGEVRRFKSIAGNYNVILAETV